MLETLAKHQETVEAVLVALSPLLILILPRINRPITGLVMRIQAILGDKKTQTILSVAKALEDGVQPEDIKNGLRLLKPRVED